MSGAARATARRSAAPVAAEEVAADPAAVGAPRQRAASPTPVDPEQTSESIPGWPPATAGAPLRRGGPSHFLGLGQLSGLMIEERAASAASWDAADLLGEDDDLEL